MYCKTTALTGMMLISRNIPERQGNNRFLIFHDSPGVQKVVHSRYSLSYVVRDIDIPPQVSKLSTVRHNLNLLSVDLLQNIEEYFFL